MGIGERQRERERERRWGRSRREGRGADLLIKGDHILATEPLCRD